MALLVARGSNVIFCLLRVFLDLEHWKMITSGDRLSPLFASYTPKMIDTNLMVKWVSFASRAVPVFVSQ